MSVSVTCTVLRVLAPSARAQFMAQFTRSVRLSARAHLISRRSDKARSDGKRSQDTMENGVLPSRFKVSSFDFFSDFVPLLRSSPRAAAGGQAPSRQLAGAHQRAPLSTLNSTRASRMGHSVASDFEVRSIRGWYQLGINHHTTTHRTALWGLTRARGGGSLRPTALLTSDVPRRDDRRPTCDLADR